jgi:hypothetical protein
MLAPRPPLSGQHTRLRPDIPGTKPDMIQPYRLGHGSEFHASSVPRMRSSLGVELNITPDNDSNTTLLYSFGVWAV